MSSSAPCCVNALSLCSSLFERPSFTPFKNSRLFYSSLYCWTANGNADETCALLGYYVIYSGNPCRRFGEPIGHVFKGQEIQEESLDLWGLNG